MFVKGNMSRYAALSLMSLVLVSTWRCSLASKSYPITTQINAKWHQTPLYLEVAEYLADENPVMFWDFLKAIQELDKSLTEYETDSQQYNVVMNIVRRKLSDVQVPLLKLIVSLHSLTPRIQTHFQISNEINKNKACNSNAFVQIGEEVVCSFNEMEKLVKNSKLDKDLNEKKIETYTFDHFYPGSENNSKTVVLYGDIGTKEFGKFNDFLVKEAAAGRIRYLVRYFLKQENKKLVRLSGYGVELHLKSTEYKSQDDAPKQTDDSSDNSGDDDANSIQEVQGLNFKVLKGRFPTLSRSLDQLRKTLLQDNEEIPQLKAWEFQDLGLQAAMAIAEVKGEEALQILQFTAHNFPMQSKVLLGLKVSADLRNEVKHNADSFSRSLNIAPPDGALFVNGLYFDADSLDLNALLETLRSEMRVLDSFHANKIQGTFATSLLALDFTNSNSKDFAMDIRDTAILWINDIEKDAVYNRWPNSVMDLLRPTFPGMLRNVKKNLFNLVLVVDPLSTESRNLVQLAESFIAHMAPLRLGLVFDTRKSEEGSTEEDYNALICAFNYVTQKKNSRAALTFLTEIYSNVGAAKPIKKKDIKKHLQKTFSRVSSQQLDEVMDTDSDFDYGKQLALEFVNRLGFTESPQALMNGVPFTKTMLSSDNEFEEAIFNEVTQQISNVQKAVYRGELTDSDNVMDYLMNQPHVMPRLNQRILGSTTNNEDKLMDFSGEAAKDLNNVALLGQLSNRDMTATLMKNIKYFVGKHSTESFGDIKLHLLTIWVSGDLEEEKSRDLLLNALTYVKTGSSVRVAFLPNAEGQKLNSKENLNRLVWAAVHTLPGPEATNLVLKWLKKPTNIKDIPDTVKEFLPLTELHMKMLRVYNQRALGLKSQERLVIANGNLYGPLEPNESFGSEDFGLVDRFHALHYGDKIRKVLKKLMQNDDLAEAGRLDSDTILKVYSALISRPSKTRFKMPEDLKTEHSVVKLVPRNPDAPHFDIISVVDPASRNAQKLAPILVLLRNILNCRMDIYLTPQHQHSDMPVKNFYRFVIEPEVQFDASGSLSDGPYAKFTGIPSNPLLTQNLQVPENWLVEAVRSVYDLDNIKLSDIGGPVHSEYELEYLLLEGHCFDSVTGAPPRGLQITLGTSEEPTKVDTIVMANLGYFQLKANPGIWELRLRDGKSSDLYEITSAEGPNTIQHNHTIKVVLSSLRSHVIKLRVTKKPGMQNADLLGDDSQENSGIWNSIASSFGAGSGQNSDDEDGDVINIFSVASGHLYERLLRIMMLSLMKHTKSPVKFWFLKNYLSPQFTDFLPHMAKEYGFKYELVQYKWPRWLHQQTEKQRTIWGYKILFLDVLFPLSVRKIIFVDADAIVRADIKELYDMDLGSAPYAYTPFCDSRKEMEGFRFWKQGYWKNHLMGRRYHISALYVVDLRRFRRIAAGDRLRGQYQALSQDPNSLSNLDQDLPNNMIHQVSIKSLPDDWLWCQTWCSDSSLKNAKVIDLCNNPMTKEAKLTAAQRIVPEWKDYDAEIKSLMSKIEDHENHELSLNTNNNDDVTKSNEQRTEMNNNDKNKHTEL